MFARLAINLPAVSGMFDYAIPPEFAGQIGPGSLVTAPFGNQTVQGVVMELVDVPSVATGSRSNPCWTRCLFSPSRRWNWRSG